MFAKTSAGAESAASEATHIKRKKSFHKCHQLCAADLRHNQSVSSAVAYDVVDLR
jgi:hypothetical protein